MDLNKHKKAFGNQAENYTKYRKPYPSEVFALLFSKANPEGGKILDVACGTGKSTEPLIQAGWHVFGVDHDVLMIEEAKKQAEIKKLDIKYSVGNVEELPFEDETFHAITVGTAFHWFVNEKSINELRRVLKKDGLLFIYWTLSSKEIPEEDRIPVEIFQKYNWDRVPPKLRDLNHISKFLEDSGMNEVSTSTIPFIHHDTVEDQVGLMKTASAYEILTEEDKEKFNSEVTEIMTRKLGNRKFFTYDEEIQIIYGYK